MNRLRLGIVLVAALGIAVSTVMAKDAPWRNLENYRFQESPAHEPLPADLQRNAVGTTGASMAAVPDTFLLASFDFDNGGVADTQGWVSVDINAQLGVFFHVADGTELNGGSFGNLVALEGSKSVWCGAPPSNAEPFCGWATLPGYGNNWTQYFSTGVIPGDSLRIAYKVAWDGEPAYDGTRLQYSGDGGATWTSFPVNGGRPQGYDTNGKTVAAWTAGGLGSVQLRFIFGSDGAWSDEDGLWPTDGAVLLDSITIETYSSGASNGVLFSDFESAAAGDLTDGVWFATGTPGYGTLAALYPGVTLLQEDPCFVEFDNLWGWFDDPVSTNYACHTPDPRPDVGAVPFGGAATSGLYMWNEIWSPLIPNVGSGDAYVLQFRTYRDLPLDNLVFYQWHVRNFDTNGCSLNWEDDSFVFFGGQRDWLFTTFNIGAHVNANAPDLQLAISALDACGFWCSIFGSGACHSHAPLVDDVRLLRIDTLGPQYSVRHIDLFQDTFAEDGTLTGTARADMAQDILPGSNGNILPGDSIAVTVTNVGNDALSGTGPSVYVYVAVWPQNQAGKSGANIEAPEMRAPVGKRFPLVNSTVHNGATWYCFRMDSALTQNGGIIPDRYAFDLNDAVFNPCDTICYVLGASDGSGNSNYWSRRLSGQGVNFVTSNLAEALESPMEFTVLPAGGWKRGGDILYVDDADDRGGPPQLFFDSALDIMGIRDQVDRYDVMGPSSNVGNSLAARVNNVPAQLQNTYRKILWNTGNLSSGLVGDGGTANGGGGADKSDDWSMLYQWIDTHPDNPGIYFSGDDLASDWANVLTGTGAVNFRSVYTNFNLNDNDHKLAGEPVSPLLTGVGPCFLGDQLIAYGGCPALNDFDLLQATGSSVSEFASASGRTYVLSQATPNSAGSTARVVLSGFSYHYIRDLGGPVFPIARVEHLQHVLEWLINLLPIPSGIDPLVFANDLDPAYPNPFNPSTTIRYSIRAPGHVRLAVYNVAGQQVRTLVNEMQRPRAEGFSVEWDGRNDAGNSVSSGVYFYRLLTRDYSKTRKAVLLK